MIVSKWLSVCQRSLRFKCTIKCFGVKKIIFEIGDIYVCVVGFVYEGRPPASDTGCNHGREM